jgi:hypothetical protein
MSKAFSLVLFCPEAGNSAAAAGAPVNRRATLRSEHNAKSTTPATNVTAVSLANLTEENMALFQSGKRYKVTIEATE